MMMEIVTQTKLPKAVDSNDTFISCLIISCILVHFSYNLYHLGSQVVSKKSEPIQTINFPKLENSCDQSSLNYLQGAIGMETFSYTIIIKKDINLEFLYQNHPT